MKNYLSAGNSKLGRGIKSFSRTPSKVNCVGQTTACSKVCYIEKALKMYPSVRRLYARNDALTPEQIESQDLGGVKVVRMHVAADFHIPAYTLAWRRLAKRFPQVRFYGYTRSWRIPNMLPSLLALKALPNVQLFASIDEETGLAPAGWQFAMMGQLAGHNAPGSIQCPNQTGKVADCTSCKLCFNPSFRGNLTFAIH